MGRFNQVSPSLDAHRLKAFDKKSRSTTNWPILAWSRSTSAAVVSASFAGLFENVEDIPAMACFFHVAIIVGSMPYFAAKSATAFAPH